MTTYRPFACRLLASVAAFGLAAATHAAQPAPFTSDGCSRFPDGTPAQQTLWLACCTAHDRAYWLGGTYAERQAADAALRVCVEQVGEPEIALLMLAGVRVGGSPFWPTRFRWGYGWPYLENGWPRGYRALTDEERRLVKQLERDTQH